MNSIKFIESAAVDIGHIPDHILEDKELAAHICRHSSAPSPP